MSSEVKKPLGIKSTCLYGKVEENSKYYDVRDEVGKSLLDYRLVKIKCQIKSNDSRLFDKNILLLIIGKEMEEEQEKNSIYI